jgi:DNA-binding MarR family transcriptional regulator
MGSVKPALGPVTGRDEGNQRYVRLYLTPAGTEIAARLWQSG